MTKKYLNENTHPRRVPLPAIRTVKMVRPICVSDEKTGKVGCQDVPNAPTHWYKLCTHNPYFSISERKETRPILEDREDGSKVVKGHEEIIHYEQTPNIVQVPLTQRHYTPAGLRRMTEAKRMLGYMLPEEHPDGNLLPVCQLNECWVTGHPRKGLPIRASWGDFCCESHSKAVWMDTYEKPVEILNQRKIDSMWAEAKAV